MTESLMRDPVTSKRLNRGLPLLMSTATGLSVAGNYFAQPLFEVIGRELGLSTTMATLTVTAAQGGYALGLILLIPLGDLVERHRLAVLLLAATSVFLLWRFLPRLHTRSGLSYPALLRSTLAMFGHEPLLGWRHAVCRSFGVVGAGTRASQGSPVNRTT